MSSVWDSRFSDDGGRAVASYQSRRDNETVGIGDILAATKSELPYIGPERLQFHGVLGAGSSFKVNREVYTKPIANPSPYFVAVKHMLLPLTSASGEDANRQRQLYGNVMREIRVLMHPPLRDHCCIIPALGYGWTNHPTEGANPYLIVDYSDHGTLNRYFQRCNIPLHERRELALDVAFGIKVLHDSKIIHGDVKPENILVFDTADDYSERPQTAKIADFGSSLFEEDMEKNISYLGTSKYNAPEIEGRGNARIMENLPKMPQYKKADIYSFGLLLWETLKNGVDFIDRTWLEAGEADSQFLGRICGTEKDGMLQEANTSCEKLRNDGVKPSLLDPIQETLGLALRDDASLRANIDEIVESLARGSKYDFTETRGPTRYPLATISPPTEPYGLTTTNAEHLQRAMPLPKQIQKARYMPIRYALYSPPKDQRLFPMTTLVKETLPAASQDFVYKALDMFQVSITSSPPWLVQCDIVDKLKMDVKHERDSAKHSEASLQFSICYRLGFGIEPNLEKMLLHLSDAAKDNVTARSVLARVLLANEEAATSIRLDISPLDAVDRQLDKNLDPAIATKARPESRSTLVHAATIGADSELESLLAKENIGQEILSDALVAACKYGHFQSALLLLSKCQAYRSPSTQPTPLHWLIMFDESQVAHLAKILVHGPPGESPNRNGICGKLLDAVPESTVNFPEQCMDLLGSPLHWAVRIRHLPLVRILIELGADVNLRWKARRELDTEPSTTRLPSYSPLDLAVAFHCSDVVDALLRSGATLSGGAFGHEYTALHLIGQAVFPFTYDVMHGRYRREVVRQVIHSLVEAGCNIDALDSDGKTPLARSLENPDLEDYILEELLSAGALVDSSITRHNENAAIIIAQNSLYRRLNTSGLRLVSPRVKDINERNSVGSSCRNALHYCAAGRSGRMTEVLLADSRISVDERTSDDQTALHLAATSGSSEVIHLLVRAGASLQSKNQFSETPLEIATMHRWTDAAHALISYNAAVVFTNADDTLKNTVIHAAAANDKDSKGIVAELLEKHYALRKNKILLNMLDCHGWTALHQAAYYGDIESVTALVQAGADSSILSHENHTEEGLTPLEVTRKLMKTASATGFGSDHDRVKDGGPVAIAKFKACLERILTILENGA
ncbi:ankyrin [Glonium stellatum]|uniref:Ankyrin n=1 Tax=Glonium stellatum TaxID=574774 RepID=A0A8E2EMV6_9PEZI|nr:ankyrin [Glonium stellatum]